MKKTVTLLVALFALAVSTWADPVQVGDFYYEIYNYGVGYAGLVKPASGTYALTGDIVIPGTIDVNGTNYPVWSVGYEAFDGCSGITSITVEEGVEFIDNFAFLGCTGLTSVTLPSTITSLGNQIIAWSDVTTLTLHAATPPTCDTYSLDDASALAHIYVPAANVNDYKAAAGWSAHAAIIEEIPATPTPPTPTPSSTTITWDATDLTTIHLFLSGSQTIKDITAIADAPDPDGGDYCHFLYDDTYPGSEYTAFSISGNATFSFVPASGKLTRIVINCSDLAYWNMATGLGWTWDDVHGQLVWSGAATSVLLAGDGSANYFTSGWISSIEFTVEEDPAPASNPTITWEQRQVKHVALGPGTLNEPQSSPVIKDIIASLTRTNDGICQFYSGTLWINGCGDLTFQSLVGDFTGIVITCSSVSNAADLPVDWMYDSGSQTVTWIGTAAEQVTLSGNVNIEVASIEFTYSPAAAPRLGQFFYDASYLKYQITGAHTAKLASQYITHTLDIPASCEDGGVTYYITEIADYAFYNNDDLPNAYIGYNISKIGVHAFEGCVHMTDFNLYSEVVDTIGDEAFKDCHLMQIFECYTSEPSVLGSNAFGGDNRLNHIIVYTPEAYQAAAGWNTYSPLITSYSGAPVIGEEVFWSNQKTTGIYEVTSVSYNNPADRKVKVLPYSAEVNAIYPFTFEGTLVISEEVSYIHNQYTVTGIGANAYKDCSLVNVVLIPQGITSIESGAFLNCTGVKNVFFLWNDPTTVTWADGNVGAELATAASGNTKIIVPTGKLAAYQAWAPAWAGCMMEGELLDVTASQDPDHNQRFYCAFYDSSTDYMLPPSVWAHVGYLSGSKFVLRPIAFDGEIIPAGTPVILESETPTYRLIAVGANASPARRADYTGPNDLIGTDVDLPRLSLGEDADRVYVLGWGTVVDGIPQVGMGLYHFKGETLAAHKAYMILHTPSGSPAPECFLFQHEEEPVGIEKVQNDNVQCTKMIRDGQLIIVKDGKEFNAQGYILK